MIDIPNIHINKFGDRISWEKHVIELVTTEKHLFHQPEPNSEILNNIKKYKQPPAKLLDCGCHIGRWVEYFSKSNYDYTGIDQSEYVIKVAKRLHPNNTFINIPLWKMEFNQEFDVAITVAVLQHNTLDEQEKILPRIYNALKPKGIFFTTESTTKKETETQRTHQGWINFIESHGFKFLESWHKNELGIHDHYILIKE